MEIFICSSCPVQRIETFEPNYNSIGKNKDDENGNLERSHEILSNDS